MSTYWQIEDDEIMFIAPGVCPPAGIGRTHVCKGTFSYLGFFSTFKLNDVVVKADGSRAGDRDCRFCGERLT